MLLEIIREFFGNNGVDRAPRFNVAELLLGLAFKLRILDLDRNDRSQTFTDVFSGQVAVCFAENICLPRIVIKCLRDRVMEADHVHAAFRRIDIVDKAVFRHIVGVVVLHSDFHIDVILRAVKIQDIVIQRRLAAVKVRDIFLDAAFIVENIGPRGAVLQRVFRTQIPERDLKPLCQKRHFAQSLLDDFIVVNRRFLKDFRIRLERNRSSRVMDIAGSDLMQLFRYMAAVFKTDLIDLALLPDRDFQPGRERVDYRCADAVQTTGYLISSAAEFAAGMQNRIDNLYCRFSGFMVNAYRNSAAVISDGNRLTRIDGHFNMCAEARERFIDRVVDDLIHQMVQAS